MFIKLTIYQFAYHLDKTNVNYAKLSNKLYFICYYDKHL